MTADGGGFVNRISPKERAPSRRMRARARHKRSRARGTRLTSAFAKILIRAARAYIDRPTRPARLATRRTAVTVEGGSEISLHYVCQQVLAGFNRNNRRAPTLAARSLPRSRPVLAEYFLIKRAKVEFSQENASRGGRMKQQQRRVNETTKKLLRNDQSFPAVVQISLLAQRNKSYAIRRGFVHSRLCLN